MPTHKLGKRMHNNVGAEFDRPQQDRCGDGVVDDQRHAVFVCHPGQLLDVADISRRVANAFTEDGPRFLIDQLLYRLRAIRLGESDSDSLAGQQVGEERMSRPVELRQS